MGNCCPAKGKPARTDRRHGSQTHAMYEEILYHKENSMIARQHQVYLLRENKLLIYDTDLEIAWIEDISMRGRVSGDYLSVKTGPNELFVVQGTYAVLIDVPLRTGVDRAPPPIPLSHCAIGYQSRKVFAAAERPLVFLMAANAWRELQTPQDYSQHSGCFLTEDKWYLVGGVRRNKVTPSVLIYSLVAETWLLATFSLPVAVKLPACIPLSESEVIITSGYNSENRVLPDSFLFDFVKFEPVERGEGHYEKEIVMAIGYRRRGFLVRGDGAVTVYRRKQWSDINIEKIAEGLLNVDTEASIDEETERKRAKIPKKPQRPERLYTYSAVFDEENCFLVEMNNVSLESRQIDVSCYSLRPLPACGMCLIPGNLLLVAGGIEASDSEVNQTLVYDCNNQQFRATADLQQPQAFMSIIFQGEFAYGLGSVSRRDHAYRHRLPLESFFQRYWVSESRWEQMTPPPSILMFSSLCVLGQSLYAVGGLSMRTPTVVDYAPMVQVFHTAENVWRRLDTPYPVPAARPHSCNTLQGRVLIFAGVHLTSTTTLTDTFIFDGKSFKERGEVNFECELSCPVVGKDGGKVFAVDMRGLYRVFDLETGKWEEEREELKASVY